MLTIGEVARQLGMQPSAIRYYETRGLMPVPQRRGGKRVYDRDVLDRLALIQLAKAAGFSLDETRELFRDIDTRQPASAVWRKRAAAKRADLDAQIRRATRMKHVLSILTTCNCGTASDCGRIVNMMRERLGLTPEGSRKRRS